MQLSNNDIRCPKCIGQMFSHGVAESGRPRYECKDCGFRTTTPRHVTDCAAYAEKNLIISDTHAPKHNKKMIAAILEYAAEYRPNRIIHLGDVGEYESISHWMENKRLELEGLTIQDDLDAACDLLKEIGSVAPAAEKVVLLGNHDMWVYDYVNAHPELRKTISVTKAYQAVGWTVIPWNELYRIGKLYLTHGLYTNKYHAYSTVHALSSSCLYGHTHDHQVFTESFLDGEKMAMSGGCTCDMNPAYLKNRPKRWVNGFPTVDVIPTGDFFIDFIKTVNGRFSRMGRIYGGK